MANSSTFARDRHTLPSASEQASGVWGAPASGIRGPTFYTAVFRRGPELQGMNPEGESIKPDNEDQDDSKDIDTEDIDSDKTEGDELKQ
jgi:hypothetical protein